ncbi:UNVERIFIED_CONTAM: hypothetical protein PYX00_009749 [Menopon gallinae]|uniref:E3 ubiquitin-protein ligase MSL2 n=1 Tax=Menopon gallinae TaxID=328185 RepID=A0AAW2HCJ3_9NEOP
MNATSLYVSTCRLVLQANPDDPGCWTDLYRLIPYLRQSLSCTVCGNLLIEPYTPTETNCQHHVCRTCKGGKKRLKPTCSWCKNYAKYIENVQLRILLQCYKKLCEYIMNTTIFRLMCKTNTSAIGDTNIANLTDLIQEGAGFKDEFKSSTGLSKSAYSILPCVYTSASTQTITQAISMSNDLDDTLEEDVPASKSNLSNGSSIYSVSYAGNGNKMVIKRKAMLSKSEISNCENLNLMKSASFKRPFHRRGGFRGRGRPYKFDEKNFVNDSSIGSLSSSNYSRMNNKRKKLGCRCGNATASPGKLTCCGQRCPCYVDSKACLDCKCRGCRNPHTKEGQKIIRDVMDSTNGKIQSPIHLTEDSITTSTLDLNSSTLEHHILHLRSDSGHSELTLM